MARGSGRATLGVWNGGPCHPGRKRSPEIGHLWILKDAEPPKGGPIFNCVWVEGLTPPPGGGFFISLKNILCLQKHLFTQPHPCLLGRFWVRCRPKPQPAGWGAQKGEPCQETWRNRARGKWKVCRNCPILFFFVCALCQRPLMATKRQTQEMLQNVS